MSDSQRELSYINGNHECVVILHEIYGINDFIKMTANKFCSLGFDVLCPDMNEGKIFAYNDTDNAYDSFYKNSNNSYEKVSDTIKKLIPIYHKVFVLGFSAGATFAWRVSCDLDGIAGTVTCYGSRIRDYTDCQPKSDVLCVFAKHDSFDVKPVADKLSEKKLVTVKTLEANHGFMDSFTINYNESLAKSTMQSIFEFFNTRNA